jgi:dihydrofolate reductase
MAHLIYGVITSLDGFVADVEGNFEWAAPDEEVHAFVNDMQRPIGTHLYGRRMYDVLHVWQHPEEFADDDATMLDYAAIWQAADKVVYSTTLDSPRTPRTRIERTFDPGAVGALKAAASADISIGGPELAKQAFAAGLIDEVHMFLNPVVIGAGNAALPADQRIDLELLDERRFEASGVVYLRYRVR